MQKFCLLSQHSVPAAWKDYQLLVSLNASLEGRCSFNVDTLPSGGHIMKQHHPNISFLKYDMVLLFLAVLEPSVVGLFFLICLSVRESL